MKSTPHISPAAPRTAETGSKAQLVRWFGDVFTSTCAIVHCAKCPRFPFAPPAVTISPDTAFVNVSEGCGLRWRGDAP